VTKKQTTVDITEAIPDICDNLGIRFENLRWLELDATNGLTLEARIRNGTKRIHVNAEDIHWP
jgi:hypothetical protein